MKKFILSILGITVLSTLFAAAAMPCSLKAGAWGYECNYGRCNNRFDCNVGCVCFKDRGPIYEGVCVRGN